MEYPLLTSRLSISPLAASDLDAFVSYRQDPAIARYQGWDADYSKEQGKSLIDSQRAVTLPSHGNWLQLGLRHREDGQLVGDVAIHNLDEPERSVELGFTIARPYQGKGFAKEAVSEVMAHLREHKFSKFVANTDARNAPSIAILTRLGFNQVPEKSWTEQFKGELVTVLWFETN
jgi:RimJ/RimL family protein N-acetyltransferase